MLESRPTDRLPTEGLSADSFPLESLSGSPGQQMAELFQLGPGDLHATQWLAGRLVEDYQGGGDRVADLFVLAGWVFAQVADGHTVADLNELTEDLARRWHSASGLDQNSGLIKSRKGADSNLPSFLQIDPGAVVAKYPQVFGDTNCPFVVTGQGRYIYLNRFYQLEQRFLQAIAAASGDSSDGRDLAAVRKHVKKSLPYDLTAEQKAAWTNAMRHHFAIVCGGPGTGKTTLVVAILMGFVYDFLQRRQSATEQKTVGFRTCIAAPTGRAAFRVLESIRSVMEQAGDSLLLNDYLPNACFTVHKLLGLGHGRSPRYHAQNPLPYDVIVLDEASMMDMQLMTLLLEAKAPSTRLLIIGDPDQLPSVDTGAVLHNLTRPPQGRKHKLAPRTSFLTVGHRSQGEVREFIGVVADGDQAGFNQFMDRAAQRSVAALGQPMDSGLLLGQADSETIDAVFEQFFPVAELQTLCKPGCLASETVQWRDSLRQAFAIIGSLAVLTPFRRGRLGSEELNNYFLKKFFRKGLRLSAGVPLLITRNDYELELFNGDRGVTVAFDDGLYAVFPRYAQQARSTQEQQEFNRVPLERLLHVEPAFVTTVHKSQGSEYDQVLFLLPPGREEQVGRQLVYTAITRARRRLILAADPSELWAALGRPQLRRSGILDKLTSP